MAVIRIKRGSYTPTTSTLSHTGELGVNYNNGKLYVRISGKVVQIGSSSSSGGGGKPDKDSSN